MTNSDYQEPPGTPLPPAVPLAPKHYAPLWAKALWALGAVAVLVIVVLHLTGHAPMGHRADGG